MIIKVLGTGCANCRSLEKQTRQAVAELGLPVEVVKVEDIMKILEYNVMRTPALVIDENGSLEDGFFQLFDLIRAGKLPVASAEKYKAVDAGLNAVYGSLQTVKEPEWGTVTKTGIKKTQREWIRYRDAWLLFCRKKFSNVSPDSIRTWLTLKRIEMLKEMQ